MFILVEDDPEITYQPTHSQPAGKGSHDSTRIINWLFSATTETPEEPGVHTPAKLKNRKTLSLSS